MSENIKPEVGMGATRYAGTDAYPYTVTEVSPSGNKITVTRDKAVRSDSNGLSESQSWDITTDPSAAPNHYSRRKDGHFRLVGQPMESWNILYVGSRRRYNDPHV